jgi:TRAP-type C4-dicarboxylate transport system substrate-binding protein
MYRRQFLKASALVGGGLIAGTPAFGVANAQQGGDPGKPIRIILGGYGPSTSSFSQGLKHIGDRLEARFGSDVDIDYVYNILDLGYDAAGDLTRLVDDGVLSLAYLTMFENIPELQLAALPFGFADSAEVRAVMDGALGQSAIKTIEANTNFRILGFFENGFRHISNNVRPVHTPADLKGLRIRVLGVQARTFEMLGANPVVTPLPAVRSGLESGELDGQENPFENVVTYGLYHSQRYYTATYHSYLSRPIFVHRPTFDAWPEDLQIEMRAAVQDAVILQRQLHDQAEIDAAAIIRASGGEIVELTPDERKEFLLAVVPILVDASSHYDRKLLRMLPQ